MGRTYHEKARAVQERAKQTLEHLHEVPNVPLTPFQIISQALSLRQHGTEGQSEQQAQTFKPSISKGVQVPDEAASSGEEETGRTLAVASARRRRSSMPSLVYTAQLPPAALLLMHKDKAQTTSAESQYGELRSRPVNWSGTLHGVELPKTYDPILSSHDELHDAATMFVAVAPTGVAIDRDTAVDEVATDEESGLSSAISATSPAHGQLAPSGALVTIVAGENPDMGFGGARHDRRGSPAPIPHARGDTGTSYAGPHSPLRDRKMECRKTMPYQTDSSYGSSLARGGSVRERISAGQLQPLDLPPKGPRTSPDPARPGQTQTQRVSSFRRASDVGDDSSDNTGRRQGAMPSDTTEAVMMSSCEMVGRERTSAPARLPDPTARYGAETDEDVATLRLRSKSSLATLMAARPPQPPRPPRVPALPPLSKRSVTSSNGCSGGFTSSSQLTTDLSIDEEGEGGDTYLMPALSYSKRASWGLNAPVSCPDPRSNVPAMGCFASPQPMTGVHGVVGSLIASGGSLGAGISRCASLQPGKAHGVESPILKDTTVFQHTRAAGSDRWSDGHYGRYYPMRSASCMPMLVSSSAPGLRDAPPCTSSPPKQPLTLQQRVARYNRPNMAPTPDALFMGGAINSWIVGQGHNWVPQAGYTLGELVGNHHQQYDR